MTVHVNLFGGPGIGKSTAAAGTFHKMKLQRKKVELVTEYAKGLVYSECFHKMGDQILITAKQNHKLFRLEGKVDYIINDAPILLGAFYADLTQNKKLPKESLKNLILDQFNSYTNLNIFLKRSELVYQEYGRSQTEEEALKVDEELKKILKN